jgi:GT2 family glycosyltransferase
MDALLVDVTVAISTLGRPGALARCLDALLSGSAVPREIVVVDQSRDNATQLAVEQRQLSCSGLTYIRHAGRGLGASQNLAFKRAAAPVIAVLDDDCVPAPSWTQRIGEAFRSDDALGMVTGRVLPLGPAEPGRYPVSSRTRTTRTEFRPTAMPWEIGSGNNFAAKRSWLRRVSGNDPRLGPGAPGRGGVDMDLFYRLLRAGALIRYEPEVLVYHEQATRAERLARRGPYGYGMGACCGIWLRQGDYNAIHVARNWMASRMWRLAGALRHRRWELVREEALILGGTCAGFIYGLRLT